MPIDRDSRLLGAVVVKENQNVPIKHACFISYCHGKYDLVNTFIPQLVKALQAYLDPYFEDCVFIDVDNLRPGDPYNEKLAEAICHSVCMIVVYFPRYDEHLYCLREYTAMEILEDKRLKSLGKTVGASRRMIIPIILRGKKEDLPPSIQDHIQFCDFSKFTTAAGDITKNPEYVGKIDEIAYYVYDLYKEFRDAEQDVCLDCISFRLPDEKDVKPWRSKVKSAASPFPLR